MEDAPWLLKIPKSECPDIWRRLPKHKWTKSCKVQHGRPSRSSSAKSARSSSGRTIREKELLLSVYVDGIKLAGKKQNIEPMWKVLMKDVDLG